MRSPRSSFLVLLLAPVSWVGVRRALLGCKTGKVLLDRITGLESLLPAMRSSSWAQPQLLHLLQSTPPVVQPHKATAFSTLKLQHSEPEPGVSTSNADVVPLAPHLTEKQYQPCYRPMCCWGHVQKHVWFLASYRTNHKWLFCISSVSSHIKQR